jgi:hypothetical protein
LSDAELGTLPQRLPALRNLALIEMEQLTGESLAAMAKWSASLVALDVRLCGRLSAGDYRYLVSMPKLADLKIGGFAVTDDVLTAIAPLPSLRGLTIDDALFTKDGFEKFAANFASAEKLETLVLQRNMAVSDDALLVLGNLPRLRRLILGDAMVTGAFLSRLAEEGQSRPKLGELSLRKTFLTEEAIQSLEKYPELRSLQISGTVLSRKGVETLLSLSGLERLDLTDSFLDDDARQYLQETELLPKSLKSLKY